MAPGLAGFIAEDRWSMPSEALPWWQSQTALLTLL